MNKCLVTTLKASTNNEALSKYNVLTIKTRSIDSPTIDSQWIGLGTSENGSISVNSPSVGLYQSGISGELHPYPYTVQANQVLWSHFENKDGIVEVTGKYNLSQISLGKAATVTIKEIYGISGTINQLSLKNIEEGEIDATKLSNALDLGKLTDIQFPSEGVILTVNIINRLSKNNIIKFKAINKITPSFCALFDNIGLDDLTNNVGITNLMLLAPLNAGNLSSLAKLTNLTEIRFSLNVQNNGDIMDFINPWIQAGRTSGKIKVAYLSSQKNVTLNGSPISYPDGVSDMSAYLNWTSDGTVTFTAS